MNQSRYSSKKDKSSFSHSTNEKFRRDENYIHNINPILLNQKINKQANYIRYLNSKLTNYDSIINELSNLKNEVNMLNQQIHNKNNLISEYKNLTEITKDKFLSYLSNNNFQNSQLRDKFQKYKQLKQKNEQLMNEIDKLENENFKLKTELNNITTINNGKDLIIENKLNEEKVGELICMKNKLTEYRKLKEELNEIKKKYIYLEKQIAKKDKHISDLLIVNDELKGKILFINNKYNKVLLEQKNLQVKLEGITDLCKKYEKLNDRIFNNNSNNINNNSNIDLDYYKCHYCTCNAKPSNKFADLNQSVSSIRNLNTSADKSFEYSNYLLNKIKKNKYNNI